MEIINKTIDSLIFAEYNPRQLTDEQYQQLKDSITRFGLVDPIIVNQHQDRKNIIVGGHQRTRVAKKLGIEEVPCVFVSLPYEKERELNVRLNKNTGGWDYDILADMFELDELIDWGFKEEELVGFDADIEVEGNIDDDEIPEEVEPVCKLGDIWELGSHKLLCGDSTVKENVELLLDGNKADMVFTDPPYGLGGYGGRNNMQLLGDDLDVAPFYNAIPLLDEVYVWGRVYNLVDINFEPRDIIVWRKNNFGLAKGYRGQYEVCFYKGSFKGSDSDVWDVKKDSKYEHPTQKPVELAIRAIKNSKPKKVLDIFAGSGSTLIACEKTKRVCYGMELDPHYCDVIINRWEQYTGKKARLVNGTT